jgi:hypothetical protein
VREREREKVVKIYFLQSIDRIFHFSCHTQSILPNQHHQIMCSLIITTQKKEEEKKHFFFFSVLLPLNSQYNRGRDCKCYVLCRRHTEGRKERAQRRKKKHENYTVYRHINTSIRLA